MNFMRNTKNLLVSPRFVENCRLAINRQARYVTTYNDRGPRKNRPPNQEERLAAVEASRRAKKYDEILTAFGKSSILTPDMWREFKQEPSMSSVFFTLDILKMLKPPKDSLQSAKNFLIAFNIESNIVIERHLIDLYVKNHREKRYISKADETEVLKICDGFIAKSMHELPEIQEKVVLGLSITKDWKRALSLPSVKLDEVANNILITKSIRSNEFNIAYNLMNQMLRSEQTLSPYNITVFINHCKQQPDSINAHLPKVLEYLERFQKLISENAANSLIELLKRNGKEAELTPMDYSGICGACKQSIEPVNITNAEMRQLKTTFYHRVVKGRSIYEKTTAEEWKSFETFVKEFGPFDLIIDGLNVAYMSNNDGKSPRLRASPTKLANAVEELAKTRKRILVIGRKHMNKWKQAQSELNRIRSTAKLFLVDDISHDDVFILYAALNENNSCDILSNDFMRQHKALTGRSRDIFQRWQQKHWYGFIDNKETGKTEIFQPMNFKNYCHFHEGRWHLPIITREEMAEGINWFEMKKLWACIKL